MNHKLRREEIKVEKRKNERWREGKQEGREGGEERWEIGRERKKQTEREKEECKKKKREKRKQKLRTVMNPGDGKREGGVMIDFRAFLRENEQVIE